MPLNHSTDLPLCACGCGEPVTVNVRSRKPNRYLPTHHKLKSLDAFRVDPETGCHIWLRAISRGYGMVRVDGKMRPAHTALWEQANGPVPAGLVPHHTCENKRCVNLDHIALKERGEHARGHYSILTTAQYEELLSLRSTMSQRQLARYFGVSRWTVRNYLTGGHRPASLDEAA